MAEPVPTQVVEVAAVRRQECLEAAAQTVGVGLGQLAERKEEE